MKVLKNIDYLIIGFIFLVLFALPILFVRVENNISWLHVMKIWKDQVLLIPLFAINHWVLIPRLMLSRKYIGYLLAIVGLIALMVFSYYYYDEVINALPAKVEEIKRGDRPSPVPPYANLLMYSLLITGVDLGLFFSKKWHDNEEQRLKLEKQNAAMELDILRNQVSPHFFMNTLNNIYALVDCDTVKAKDALMKLSKLMRYMLYENSHGRVKLSKEFEFIQSYIDLMRLRFADGMSLNLTIPADYYDIEIPALLFVSYIENAFKHGISYQIKSRIDIDFKIENQKLFFSCVNTRHLQANKSNNGGLGLKNSEGRLVLLYGENYSLQIQSSDELFNVSLVIPLL